MMETFFVAVGVIGRYGASYPPLFHLGIISDVGFGKSSSLHKKDFYSQ